MQVMALLLVGYSMFSALVLGLTHFQRCNYAEQRVSRIAGVLLLVILVTMQLFHLSYLYYNTSSLAGVAYRMLLFSVAPMFFIFSMPLLKARPGFQWSRGWHFIPVVVAPSLPYPVALPLAFFIGAGYLTWLARTVYGLREQRRRFRFELVLLATVFIVAIIVSIMGLGLTWVGEHTFYQLYAIAIGGAFVLVNLVLGMTPRLVDEVAEVAREAYAVSTLTQVDCDAALQRLAACMQQEKLYQQSSLDLTHLAQVVDLSTHQLSELINTRLGKNFPRYLREYRVEAAKRMLVAEPSASVLSVGLSVGFTSQSNFYEAFREITGMTPGKFRSLKLTNTPER